MRYEERQIRLFEREAKLVWFGQDKSILERLDKYILPFQTVESLCVERPKNQPDLWHELYQRREKTEWRNRLIWGDNLYVLASLLPEFRGKVDLIYIDPPFATGADFKMKVKLNGEEVEKLPSAIEVKAYRDTWSGGLASYLQWLYDRLVLMRELLSETGSIYVHLDWRVGHYVKVMMDEIFGYENFRNEIVWRNTNSPKSQSTTFGSQHQVLLLYSRSSSFKFHKVYRQFDERALRPYSYQDEKGRFRLIEIEAQGIQRSAKRKVFEFRGRVAPWLYSKETLEKWWNEGLIYQTKTGRYAKKQYLHEMPGILVSDLWVDDDVAPLQGSSKENLNYPTQKPEALLERIIKASSNPGDLVLDAFCGSGTTCAVAEKLGRRWIGIDISRYAIHLTRKRILSIEKEDPKLGKVGPSPFVIQNLGVYERQAWLATLSPKAEPGRLADYIRFVLEAYEAQPYAAEAGIHGVKGRRAVMVGPIDRAVSWIEAELALEAAKRHGFNGLDILGWEWDLELNERFKDYARARGMDVRLIKIPRDLIDGEKNVRFEEAGYISAEAVRVGRRGVKVVLRGFVRPNPEWLEDEDVKRLIENAEDPQAWSKLIDYWAVDFDYKMDTFHNGFVAFRTRKQKTLPLESWVHEYERPGEYTILVKVIDIFGIESTKALEVRIP